MKKQITFNGYYDKLYEKTFCTLRGIAWMKYTFPNEIPIVMSGTRRLIGHAIIKCRKIVNVSELPLDFLRYDVSPLLLNSYSDFYDYVNELRKNRGPFIGVMESGWETDMTLLYLAWIKKYKKLDNWLD